MLSLNPLALDLLCNSTARWTASIWTLSSAIPVQPLSLYLVGQPISLLRCSTISHHRSYSFYRPVKSSFILPIFASWEITQTIHWSWGSQILWYILLSLMVGIITLRKDFLYLWLAYFISIIWWRYLIWYFIIFVKLQRRSFYHLKCS